MNPKYKFILSVAVLSIIFRTLPHPPNFSPIAGLALFSGYFFGKNFKAILVPLIVMLLSDFCLEFTVGHAFYSGTWSVYLAFAVISALGMFIKRTTPAHIGLQSFIASSFFFLFTNFYVWQTEIFYTKDLAGFTKCFIMAIPFYQNTLIGDVLFSMLVFSAYGIFAQSRSTLIKK